MLAYGTFICEEARSGDGTLEHVGMNVKPQATFHCLECNQRYTSEKALTLHVKYTHGNRIFRVITLNREDSSLVGMTLGGATLFRIEAFATKVHDLKEQISQGLKKHNQTDAIEQLRAEPLFLTLLTDEKELFDDADIDCIDCVIVKQDMGIHVMNWD
jgi:hypothetical protein